jgi:HAD superfamily hydrolase (TIGR01490 family)
MEKVMPRPFAAFDIDGTLIRWQLYHALADAMNHMGLLDSAEFEAVRAARLTWKKRNDSFQAYELALIKLVDKSLPKTSHQDFLKACQTVMEEYKDQVYTYTRDLLRDLKQHDYLLFALSASQSEIVGMIAEYYGFDDFAATSYEVKNDYFTGHRALVKKESKPEYLKSLVQKHGAIWEGSLAIGDSESDIPLLSTVESPIAFNPSKELFDHAATNRWKIVVERKNMIYELEPSNGSYLLASSDQG